MKIIQSCWSCNRQNFFEFSAGWHSPEYHLMGWALSCLQLRKNYNEVALYADEISADALINDLKLPYTEVVSNLDVLNRYNKDLWALPKIHVYALQKESFLHVDGDVFVWKPFSNQLMSGGLIAQNIEAATKYYGRLLDKLTNQLIYFPDELLTERNNSEIIYAYNAGIFGGSDMDFFKAYTEKAKEFVDKNLSQLDSIDVSSFNIFFEQYLFYILAKKKKKEVNVLISAIIGDNGYTGLADFIEVPHNKQFLHLLGRYKKNKIICEQMANRLRQDYPEYYYRIIALFKAKALPMEKDYYTTIDEPNEGKLLSRAIQLREKYERNALAINSNDKPRNLNLVKFRSAMVINRLKELRKNAPQGNVDNYNNHLSDILRFENKLDDILKNKFSVISVDYLYARDLSYTQYFQAIFENKKNGYSKKLIAEELVEIIEGEFDWSEIHKKDIAKLSLKSQLLRTPGIVYTGVVPECDIEGYSLINLDNLDLLLLNILKKSITLSEILSKVKYAFDPDDLKKSSSDFELLITGRVKKAIHSKLIKIEI